MANGGRGVCARPSVAAPPETVCCNCVDDWRDCRARLMIALLMPANLVFCCGAARGGRRKRFELIPRAAALVVQIVAEFCVNWPFSGGAGLKASVSLVLNQCAGSQILSKRRE
jgi:hypothetical protein